MVKIYSLSSSRNPEIIRYVGKTQQTLNRRLTEHYRSAKNFKKQNYTHNYNYNWINKELNEGFKILINLIEECENSIWKEKEVYWIAYFRSISNLTNLTDGGDGNNNQIMTKESNLKRSHTLMGRKRPIKDCVAISQGSLGKKLTNAHKENVRNSIIKLQGRKINQYTLEGTFMKQWNSIIEPARIFNIHATSIQYCCKGKYKKAGNYIWKYINEDIV